MTELSQETSELLKQWFENIIYMEENDRIVKNGNSYTEYIDAGKSTIKGWKLQCNLYIYPNFWNLDEKYQNFVLIHEIAHTYSIFNENEADEIALNVLTGKEIDCKLMPVAEDINEKL